MIATFNLHIYAVWLPQKCLYFVKYTFFPLHKVAQYVLYTYTLWAIFNIQKWGVGCQILIKICIDITLMIKFWISNGMFLYVWSQKWKEILVNDQLSPYL